MNKQLKIILFSNYASVISLGLFTPIYALFVFKLGGSTLEAGTSAAMFYIVAGVLMFALRPLQDRVGFPPRLMVVGYVVGALTSILLMFVGSILQLYLVQIVHAFSAALRRPNQQALYAKHEDQGREGSEWAILEGGDFIIMGLAAASGGLIASSFSFELIFAITAALQLAAAVLCSRLIRG